MTKNNKQNKTQKPAATAAATAAARKPVQTAAEKAAAEEAQRQLFAQLQQNVVATYGSKPASYDKEVNYVMASDGVYCAIENPVGVYNTKVMETTTKVKDIPALHTGMEEGVELKVPKIPFKYWLMILTFYKDVYDKDKTEAAALFFWNHNNVELPRHYQPRTAQEQPEPIKGLIEDGQLIIYCPKQKNSGGLTEYSHDPMYDWLREHTTKYAETHSH